VPKPYRFRELFRILKDYDPKFRLSVEKGKGSHRALYHPNIDGSERAYGIPFHTQNPEIDSWSVAAIIRRFNLPKGLL
jgi:hypothetical protein